MDKHLVAVVAIVVVVVVVVVVVNLVLSFPAGDSYGI